MDNLSLGSVPSAYDYVDRTRKVKVANTKELVVDESTPWTDINGIAMSTSVPSNGIYDTLVRCLSDNFETVSRQEGQSGVKKGVLYLRDNTIVYVYKVGETLTTAKDKVKNALIRYQLATPQETQLTDEEFKAYDEHKKLILLGGAGDVKDTLEIKDDGSISCTVKRLKLELDKLPFVMSNASPLPNTVRVSANIDAANIKTGSLGVCTGFEVIPSATSTTDTQNICVVDKNLYVRVLKSNLQSETLEGVVDYIKAIKPVADLELGTPVVTYIPKELMTSIPINKINNLSVGDGVNPSSFKVVAPVDRIQELLTRMAVQEAKTNTMAVNVPFIEETYQDSQNKINEVIK